MAEPALHPGETNRDWGIVEYLDRCSNLFNALLISSDEYTAQTSQMISHALDVWARYTGARARKGLSLDDRLKDHDDLKGSIQDLLQMIHSKTSLIIATRPKQQTDVPVPLSIPADISGEQLIRDRWRAYGGSPWEAISAAVDVLMTIAFAIRSAIPKSASLLDTHYLRPDDSYFPGLAASWVRRRHPDARRSLTDQLGLSISFRRKRLLYQQRHESKYASPVNRDETAIPESHLPVMKPHHQDTNSAAPTAVKVERREEPVSITTLSTLQPTRLKIPYRPKTIVSGRTVGSLVRDDTQTEYPPMPFFSKTHLWCTCPYCFRPLKTAELQKGVDFWHKHIDEDLQPYVCLSEKCRDPPKFFMLQREWTEHMELFHGSDWPQKIHMTTWYCDREHALEEFKQEEDLRQHFFEQHKDFNEFLTEALLARNKGNGIRDPFSCPLCELAPGNISQTLTESSKRSHLFDHVGAHLLSLSFVSLPSQDRIPEDNDHESQALSSRLSQSVQSGTITKSEESSRDDVSTLSELPTVELEVPEISEEIPPVDEEYANWDPYEGLRKADNGEDKILAALRAHQGKLISLRALLKQCEVSHMDGITTFWPDQLLRETMTRERVQKSLENIAVNLGAGNALLYLDPIVSTEGMDPDNKNGAENGIEYATSEVRTTPERKYYLKIFAILVLLEREFDIGEFVEAGICDHDLPLVQSTTGKSSDQFNQSREVHCFRNWKESEVEQFYDFQYRCLIPHYCFSTDPKFPAKHARYLNRAILPWIEEDIVKRTHGGYGMISCIRIHPACYSFQDVPQVKLSNGMFALKMIKSENIKDFEIEVDMLRRLSGYHDHVIMLLMSFSYRDEYYLIFPWADSDLRGYWELNRPPYNAETGTMNPGLMQWISKQIVGLTSGLHSIHNQRSDMKLERHGDLKPENILWFKSEKNQEGVLVIADLGISMIHRKANRSNQPSKDIPHTPDYRAPECDQKGGSISRAHDIWTLGCLFLEMVCWTLGGIQMVNDFSADREKVLYLGSRVNTNIFFDIKHVESGGYVIHVKEIVLLWISKLHEHPGCTRYIHDLLDIINDSMIVVLSRDTQRIQSGPLLRKIEEIHSSVMEPDYSLLPCPESREQTPPVGIVTELSQHLMKRANYFSGNATFNSDAPYIISRMSSESQELFDKNTDDDYKDDTAKPNWLEHKLREARLRSANNDSSSFIPLSKLDELITVPTIYNELNKRDVGLKEDRPKIATQIWNVQLPGPKFTRRKIFAVLTLMRKVEAILDFIEENIFDNDLPFVFPENRSEVCCMSKSTHKPIKLFQNETKWRPHEKEVFEMYQWEMLAPYFQLSCERMKSVGHIAVDDRSVLPFIEVRNGSERGFSIVRQVRIHLAHYNAGDFPTVDKQHPYFAVKTLHFNADPNIPNNQAVQSLIKLNNENHPNLIRLLVTFQHQKNLHLVFPWADGNLQDIWQNQYPHPNIPVRDCNLARWMAQQCLGLSLGLKAIHHNVVDESEAKRSGRLFDDSKIMQGRHGDFKPNNVLWFKQNDSNITTNVTGILKISDFGLYDLHVSMSTSILSDFHIAGPTYRAPEWKAKKVVASSNDYDLWSFGCVLLEFVEWYLYGWQGVDNFSRARTIDSVTGIPYYKEDNFFNLINIEEDQKKAVVKPSVQREIQGLRFHNNCSDFILELLSYIQDRLLLKSTEDA
ncbi:hypothetical protein K505DRAFT_373045 [Melanomma pulvis-pyrius CBS 109.77]|uniref:Protein kinase domain-containing protein n=1 Tax=Melanomma pulvis-pyrius CBS 109.77 TaxID=1314802 RepID=A0A6A6XJC1_9PLEO|nr:hypothetical protein K505DRAFT_373045 [Melanomma pulvis-pyrius CBS 109.77]